MPRKAAPASPALLTLAEAARLTNMPKPYLKELVERGVVAAHVLDKGGERKLRISPAALAAAGLMERSDRSNGTERSGIEALTKLVREQSDRIAALEDQRFLLAGQLGAALERTRALEEQIVLLSVANRSPVAGKPPPLVGAGLLLRAARARLSQTAPGRALTPRIDAVITPIRYRLPPRTEDPASADA